MLQILLLFLCMQLSTQTILIESQYDLSRFINQSNISDNIFIKGGNVIKSLNSMEKLQYIGGYFAIWQSLSLQSLYGIRHLRFADSVIIEDNPSLCFANTIDWHLITNGTVTINNNNNNCSNCDDQCIGCWDIGPMLCQKCKNYLSGITCVESCPNGTIVNHEEKICLESIPTTFPLLQHEFLNDTTVKIFWDPSFESNGIIIGYNLFMNDYVINSELMTGNIWINLNTDISIFNLNYSTVYRFNLQIINSAGISILSSPLMIRTINLMPNIPENVTISNIGIDTAFVEWHFGSGITYGYQIVVTNADINKSFTFDVNNTYFLIQNLTQYTQYYINIRSFNNIGFSNYSLRYYFLTRSGIPFPPFDIVIDELGTNFVAFGWKSNDSSVIIDHYECTVFDNYTAMNNSIKIYDLIEHTDYIFKIRSVNKFGYSSYVYLNFKTLFTKPVLIDTPIILNTTDQTIFVKLQQSYNYTAYYVLNIIINGSTNMVINCTSENIIDVKNYINMIQKISYQFYSSVFFIDGISIDSNITRSYYLNSSSDINGTVYLDGSDLNKNSRWKIIPLESPYDVIVGIIILVAIVLIVVAIITLFKKKKIARVSDVKKVIKHGATSINNPLYKNEIFIADFEYMETTDMNSV